MSTTVMDNSDVGGGPFYRAARFKFLFGNVLTVTTVHFKLPGSKCARS